jgi:hypothetical protein
VSPNSPIRGGSGGDIEIDPNTIVTYTGGGSCSTGSLAIFLRAGCYEIICSAPRLPGFTGGGVDCQSGSVDTFVEVCFWGGGGIGAASGNGGFNIVNVASCGGACTEGLSTVYFFVKPITGSPPPPPPAVDCWLQTDVPSNDWIHSGGCTAAEFAANGPGINYYNIP